MRLGIFTGGAGEATPIDGLMHMAVQAEQDNFDSFWLPSLPSRNYDALIVMALAGRATTRIELGTGVVPTYPRHPLVMAQQALTAQAATNGRLTLGLGLSHRPAIEGVMGLSYDQPARHMREYLSILMPLVHAGRVTFYGATYHVNAELAVPAAAPMPVLIAALAPMMLQVAGEVSDGTITWMTGVKTISAHTVPYLSKAAQNAGRPQPRVCVGLPVAVTHDKAAGREAAASIYQRYGQLTNYRRMLDLEGAAGPEDVAIVGDEAEVTRQLHAFADAGATDFLASLFPVGNDGEATKRRTWECLKSVLGTV